MQLVYFHKEATFIQTISVDNGPLIVYNYFDKFYAKE